MAAGSDSREVGKGGGRMLGGADASAWAIGRMCVAAKAAGVIRLTHKNFSVTIPAHGRIRKARVVSQAWGAT